eukprot:scaffold13082_cov80-Isochrysis_galbana.AAC.2
MVSRSRNSTSHISEGRSSRISATSRDGQHGEDAPARGTPQSPGKPSPTAPAAAPVGGSETPPAAATAPVPVAATPSPLLGGGAPSPPAGHGALPAAAGWPPPPLRRARSRSSALVVRMRPRTSKCDTGGE